MARTEKMTTGRDAFKIWERWMGDRIGLSLYSLR